MKIANEVIELIGDTPLLRLSSSKADCQIVAKLESFNPGGSAKDRPALAMIEAAERDGLLKPGSTIIEPTSGNTGVGLAIAAAAKGYKCIFVTTTKVARSKVDLLRAYGAEAVVCPVEVAPEDPRSYYSVAQRLADETPNSFQPNQYHNQSNPEAHFDSTGPEIWKQTKGKVTHFVAGVGTGGTITGIGKYLKQQKPEVKIIAADPVGSIFSSEVARSYLVEGVGEDFWPTSYDPSIVDSYIPISDAESFETARSLARSKGLLMGGSGGTAVAAAIKLSKNLGKGDLVVVLVPDGGKGYLDKVYNDDWIRSQGFSFAPEIEGLTIKSVCSKNRKIRSVLPDNSLSSAIKVMQSSQLKLVPVATGPAPFLAAEMLGHVKLEDLESLVEQDPTQLGNPVKQHMEQPLQTVGLHDSIEKAAETLAENSAVAVLVDGRVQTLVTRSEFLERSESQQ